MSIETIFPLVALIVVVVLFVALLLGRMEEVLWLNWVLIANIGGMYLYRYIKRKVDHS